MGTSSTFANPLGGLSGALYTYKQVVRKGGPQDVKNNPGPGTRQQRIDAGNISFGVTCPFGSGFCQFAAGVAQTFSGAQIRRGRFSPDSILQPITRPFARDKL